MDCSSFYFATKVYDKNYPIRKSLTILVIACFYGTAMEYVQKYFIPNRDFDIYDIAADIVGAVLGFLIVRLTFSWFRSS